MNSLQFVLALLAIRVHVANVVQAQAQRRTTAKRTTGELALRTRAFRVRAMP